MSNRTPLASPREALQGEYPIVVIGSGYGGAITAARLAERGYQVALLERGREWPLGDFPDTFGAISKSLLRPGNPLGLIDYRAYHDIDVLKGNGLGGTSLINLSVAFRPDPELFDDPRWPRMYRDLATSGEIWRYYSAAERMLRVGPHPELESLTKYHLMKKRADQLEDARFGPVNLAVNFEPEGANRVGVEQKPCIDCGDCFPGCNVGAKNTLAMNYLPHARQKGAEIFTCIEVIHLERHASGGYTVFYRSNHENRQGEVERLRAHNVVLSAGAVGSTEILLRSAAAGLSTSAQLGQSFTGNGDFLGLGYNTDFRSNVMGFGNHPDSSEAEVKPGPTIVSAIQYNRSKSWAERITVEDFTLVPRALVGFFRRTLPVLALGAVDTDEGDTGQETRRVGLDLLSRNPEGALNHSMVYLAMAIDDGRGVLRLDDDGGLCIDWPSVRTDAIFETIDRELLAHTHALGGTYRQLDRFNPFVGGKKSNLITAHPLGGCALGDDADRGAVDPDGRVFDGVGGVHDGLFVVDGAIVPAPLAVNPLLTISALTERIAETMPSHLAS
ncbi:MAG: GMC family oxidoreductase [Thermoanaerobaculia bacterium]|nr:GMC family oxidoreductase [Thermoanaerobaculia bacterium]